MKSLWARKWLVAALITANAVLIALVAIGLKQLYERTNREAEILCQNIALAVDLHLSNEIRKIDLSLQTVVAELEHHLRGSETERNQLVGALIARQKAALPEAEAWSVTDSEGKIRFHEGNGVLPPFAAADRDYFRDLKSGRITGLVVSKSLKSRLTGNWVVVLARAIRDSEGRFNGVVVVPLPVKSLNQMLSGFELGRRGVISLRDTDLGLITRFPERQGQYQASIGDTRVSQTLRERVAAGQTQATYHAVAPFDNLERIFNFRTLSNAPIHVLAGISKEDFLEEWRNTAWQISGVFFFLLVTCNAAVVLFYREWRLQKQSACALQEGNARLETSLQHLRERDDALVAAQQVGMLGTYTLEIATQKWACSEQLRTIFGVDAGYPHTIEGWQQLMCSDDRTRMIRHFSTEVVEKRGVFDQEYRIVRPCDGQIVWVHGLGRLDFDPTGQPLRMSGTIQDITERKLAEEALRLSEERYRATFQTSLDVISLSHLSDGKYIDVNQAFLDVMGYDRSEINGRTALELGIWENPIERQHFVRVLERDSKLQNLEARFRRKNGNVFWGLFSAVEIRLEEVPCVLFVIRDITEKKQAEEKINNLVFFDQLTGLPNRDLLHDRLNQTLAASSRSGRYGAVLCINLDGFKKLNDTLGASTGDVVLQSVAQRLAERVRADDTVSRFGGDEFIVVLKNLGTNESEAAKLAEVVSENMLSCLDQGFDLNNEIHYIKASVGATIFLGNQSESDTLLKQADFAMTRAKSEGGGILRFFDPAMEVAVMERVSLEKDLRQAIIEKQFILHYQGQVLGSRVVGAEVLLRWQHPIRGFVSPADFIPLAEETGLILPLGQWVLETACAQLAVWQTQSAMAHLTIAVNVSARQFHQADFVDQVMTALNHTRANPERLKLELTESLLISDVEEVIKKMYALKGKGVGFSLDDFGTGYSSLSYLKRLPLDQLKIDQSFIRDVLVDTNDASIARTIISLGQNLGLNVIAEGVETEEQRDFLCKEGCLSYQGYFISRPLPVQGFEQFAQQEAMR